MQGLNPYLLVSHGPIFGGRVFLCQNDRRHLVMDGQRLEPYGLSIPENMTAVADDDLLKLRPAQLVPEQWSDAAYASPPRSVTSHQMREIAASRLSGVGLEVGALAAPFPLPLHCTTIYADMKSYNDLRQSNVDEPWADMVIPTMNTKFETLDAVLDESLDYIVASHVIEHTRDPIGAIGNAYKKLRPGGTLLLVTPDMRRTFDRERPLTPLAHLIEDFKEPSHDRDAEHHQHFHKFSFPAPPELYERRWSTSWSTQQPIHHHTWVYNSFAEMVEWLRQEIAPFSDVWSQDTLTGKGDCEFYFSLTK